jgi:hypothetical protein
MAPPQFAPLLKVFEKDLVDAPSISHNSLHDLFSSNWLRAAISDHCSF